MATKKMGYESLLYYGAAGSTAATQITNCRDVNYNVTPQTAPTTVKGAGSSPPIETVRVVGRQAQLTWTMLDKSDDSTLTALRAAATNGTTVAIRYLPHSGGTGFDGDVVLQCENGAPLAGEQTFNFTATPNDDDRVPALNS
jgi:hypothetical protein